MLIQKIDEKQTIKNAKELLTNYRSISRQTAFIILKKRISYAVAKCIEPERELLTAKFIQKYPQTDIAIYMNLNMSQSKYYRDMNAALLHFAEGYHKGELIAYSEDQTKSA